MADLASRREDGSMKSYATKTHPGNAETFNALSQLPKAVKTKITRDADILLNAPKWSEEIWKTMRKNDFVTQGVLNAVVVDIVYNTHKAKLLDMLGLNNTEEFFGILDADTNGNVSEDEQILLFSTIKEKMMRVAEDLCNIQEYQRYKDLMKGIRKMEVLIGKFQDYLRKKIYSSELDQYHQIGENKLDDFYKKYEEEFQQFENDRRDKLTELEMKHMRQTQELQEKLERAAFGIKFKPKKELKEYQTQEKLVSIDERVEEAMNFRRELKNLEVSEAQRVNKLREENIDAQRNALRATQQKEMTQLVLRLETEEHNLIIKMKREFDVLKKKISLHENEIKRIQGLAGKFAMKKALDEGELKRNKDKSRKINHILTSTKAIQSSFSPAKTASINLGTGSDFPMGTELGKMKKTNTINTLTLNSTSMSNQSNVQQIRNLQKSQNIPSFYLKKSFGEERPVNLKPVNYASEEKTSHKKVEVYLKSDNDKLTAEVTPLTALYDEHLNPLEKNMYEHNEVHDAQDKLRRRQFINEKLSGDKKML